MDGVAHADLQANNCHHWRKQLVTAIVNIFHSSFTPKKTQFFGQKLAFFQNRKFDRFRRKKVKKRIKPSVPSFF
jgi:hypothetical protein